MTLPRPRPTDVPRPALAGVLLLLMALVAACGGSSEDAGSTDGGGGKDGGATTTEGGPWTFTDDIGVTVTLDEAPTTLVTETMVAGGLYEQGVDVAGTFGPLTRSDGTPASEVGLADPEEFTSVGGTTYGEINLEQLAALQPDLIVAPVFEEGTYWGIDDADIEKVRAIAPIVGIKVGNQRIDKILESMTALGTALGADPDSESVTAHKADFDASSERLSDALAASPDLSVVAASGTAENMYVAVPSGYPDLSYYQSLGMKIVDPDTDEEFWQTLSWEEADRYPADLILGDARGGATAEAIISAMPESARNLPAIEADQLVPWVLTPALGYGAVAVVLDDLTAAVAAARTDIA